MQECASWRQYDRCVYKNGVMNDYVTRFNEFTTKSIPCEGIFMHIENMTFTNIDT